jgi:hypothetical protein
VSGQALARHGVFVDAAGCYVGLLEPVSAVVSLSGEMKNPHQARRTMGSKEACRDTSPRQVSFYTRINEITSVSFNFLFGDECGRVELDSELTPKAF